MLLKSSNNAFNGSFVYDYVDRKYMTLYCLRRRFNNCHKLHFLTERHIKPGNYEIGYEKKTGE